jgi:hypothetical protein
LDFCNVKICNFFSSDCQLSTLFVGVIIIIQQNKTLHILRVENKTLHIIAVENKTLHIIAVENKTLHIIAVENKTNDQL